MVSISQSTMESKQATGVGLPVGSTLTATHTLLATRFSQSPYLSLRQMTIRFHEGIITLCGRVPTFYLKQLAQQLASGLPGVEEVVNRIEVS